jgi:hypothetical protein
MNEYTEDKDDTEEYAEDANLLDSESREQVRILLEHATWDTHARCVRIPAEHGAPPHELASIEELRRFLAKAYTDFWYGRDPVEDGVAIADVNEPDPIRAVNEELHDHEDRIRGLGWTL